MKIKKGTEFSLGMNVFMLLLTLIASNIVVLSTFNILEYEILCSVFTYPFVFYFANKILKLVDKKTFFDILLSVSFIQFIVFYMMNGEILIGNFISVIAFFVCQIFFMLLTDNKDNKSEKNFLTLFFRYGSVLILDALLFNLFMNSTLDFALLYSIIFKLMVAILIIVFDIVTKKD